MFIEALLRLSRFGGRQQRLGEPQIVRIVDIDRALPWHLETDQRLAEIRSSTPESLNVEDVDRPVWPICRGKLLRFATLILLEERCQQRRVVEPHCGKGGVVEFRNAHQELRLCRSKQRERVTNVVG